MKHHRPSCKWGRGRRLTNWFGQRDLGEKRLGLLDAVHLPLVQSTDPTRMTCHLCLPWARRYRRAWAYNASYGNKGIHPHRTFAQWYNNVPGEQRKMVGKGVETLRFGFLDGNECQKDDLKGMGKYTWILISKEISYATRISGR